MSAGLAAWAAPRTGSMIDRLDARTRLLVAAAVVVTALSLTQARSLAVLIVALLALAQAGGVGWGAIGRRLAHVEGFVLVLVVFLPFTVAGAPAFRLGPLVASEPGLMRAGLLLLRVNAAALALLVLVAGLEPVRFGHALGRLGLPVKLVHLLLFAVRYVDLLRAEANRLIEAMRVRGFRPTTSRRTLRTLGHFVGQILVRSLERAERVDEGMRCRGFSGRFALVGHAAFARRDAVFAGIAAVALSALPIAERIV